MGLAIGSLVFVRYKRKGGSCDALALWRFKNKRVSCDGKEPGQSKATVVPDTYAVSVGMPSADVEKPAPAQEVGSMKTTCISEPNKTTVTHDIPQQTDSLKGNYTATTTSTSSSATVSEDGHIPKTTVSMKNISSTDATEDHPQTKESLVIVQNNNKTVQRFFVRDTD